MQGFEYGRSGNPTRNVLETCLATLENGKHGLVFASGLGATTAVTSLLQSGDHIISGDDVYGGTNRFFQKCLSNSNVKTTFVDPSNVKNIINAIRPNTKVREKRQKCLIISKSSKERNESKFNIFDKTITQ